MAKNRKREGAWMATKELATRLLRRYLSHRRWAVRYVRKFTWSMLWVRVRRSVGLLQDRQVVTGYDSVVSYARNFDDGSWKEEVEYFRSGSFAYRFGGSGRFVG